MNKNHTGSNFDEFLKEESLLEHSTAVAVKRIIAWQIEREKEKPQLTETLKDA